MWRRWLNVSDIKQIRPGLEVKFSYVYLTAMAFAGHDTFSETTYVDTPREAPPLRTITLQAKVHGDADISDAAVHMTWRDGIASEATCDLVHQPARSETERCLRMDGVA
jgi:hypothetical protein